MTEINFGFAALRNHDAFRAGSRGEPENIRPVSDWRIGRKFHRCGTLHKILPDEERQSGWMIAGGITFQHVMS